MSKDRLTLALPWRLLYSLLLLLTALTFQGTESVWPGRAAGWSGAASDWLPKTLLAVLALGRLIAVWLHPGALDWPVSNGMRRFAKVVMGITALGGLAGFVLWIAALGHAQSLAVDVRGAAAFVAGIYLIPLIAMAPLGLVLFECLRGWSPAREVIPADRVILWVAVATGFLLALAPWGARLLLAPDNLATLRYRDLLPWLLLGTAIALLIARGHRGPWFPSSPVFGWGTTGFAAASVLMALLSLGRSPLLTAGFGSALQVAGLFFAVPAALLGAAQFSLFLALVPAAVSRLLGNESRGNATGFGFPEVSTGVAMGLGIVLAGGLAWTNALRPLPPYAKKQMVSRDTLSLQQGLLGQACRKAGVQVNRTVADVAQVELRVPAPVSRGSGYDIELPVLPDPARAHQWFPPGIKGPHYGLVVFTVNGKRRGYIAPGGEYSTPRDVDVTEIQPRFFVTWKQLETPQEAAAGLAGNETSIIDSQDGSVVATQVTYFRRGNDRFGMYQDACGTLEKTRRDENYVYGWISTVLIPGGAPPP